MSRPNSRKNRRKRQRKAAAKAPNWVRSRAAFKGKPQNKAAKGLHKSRGAASEVTHITDPELIARIEAEANKDETDE